MKTSLILSMMLSGLTLCGPVSAEPRRTCDVDSNRLSGTFFLIAPDGRFCEASAEEERRYSEALDASQREAEAQAEAARAAALAKFRSDMRRSMIAGGATPADADRAVAEALGAAAAMPEKRAEQQPTGNRQAAASQRVPGAPGKCMGKSGQAGAPCVPVLNLSGIGNSIASRGLGY